MRITARCSLRRWSRRGRRRARPSSASATCASCSRRGRSPSRCASRRGVKPSSSSAWPASSCPACRPPRNAATCPAPRAVRSSRGSGRSHVMPQPSLKIDGARYVITVDDQRRITRDGSVLIENGRISRVGRADELAAARADRVIDARHFVVTPGFVNGHMHISYAHPVRGIFPDDLGSPLKQVFALQTAMTEDEEYHTTLLALLELVRNGTVCLLDPGSTKFPDACLQAYTDAGIRVILGECVTDRESPWSLPRYATGEAVARTASFVQKWHGRLQGRLSAWAMPFSPETCSADMLRGLKQVADEHRTGLTLHHGSGPQARKEYLTRHGLRPTEYLESIGTLGPNVLLAHALGLDDAEIHCLPRTGASGAGCPVTAAQGRRGVPEHGRMPELLAKGVKVALGCDSPNNSNHLDIVRAMNM